MPGQNNVIWLFPSFVISRSSYGRCIEKGPKGKWSKRLCSRAPTHTHSLSLSLLSPFTIHTHSHTHPHAHAPTHAPWPFSRCSTLLGLVFAWKENKHYECYSQGNNAHFFRKAISKTFMFKIQTFSEHKEVESWTNLFACFIQRNK